MCQTPYDFIEYGLANMNTKPAPRVMVRECCGFSCKLTALVHHPYPRWGHITPDGPWYWKKNRKVY